MLRHETVSAGDNTQLTLNIWQPEGHAEPHRVIQLLHSMSEHSMCYDEAATALAQQGNIVVAYDQRGHGKLAKTKAHLGMISNWEQLLDDARVVNEHIRQQYPQASLFMLGHAMGSVLALDYAQHHGETIDGMILSGSFYPKKWLRALLGFVATLERWRQGPQGRSQLLRQLSFRNFNERFFMPSATGFEWLNRDKGDVATYVEDEKCGFIASNNLWAEFINAWHRIFCDTKMQSLPHDIPYYLFAGTDDPIGGRNGQRVKLLANKISEAGAYSLECHLYPDGRHKMLQEVNAPEVIENLSRWMNKHTKSIGKAKRQIA